MADWTFQRETVTQFRFTGCDFDPATGVARLRYAFDQGPELVETVSFPGAPFALDDARLQAVQRALRLLHLIAGVSYYKAAVPPELVIEGEPIDADTAALMEDVYTHGLGEFAYRNGLDLRGRIRFPFSENPYLRATPTAAEMPPLPHAWGRGQGEGGFPGGSLGAPLTPSLSPASGGEGAEATATAKTTATTTAEATAEATAATATTTAGTTATALNLTPHALVAIGGGKDSLVSIEALRHAGVAQTVCWIGGSQLIAACAARTGLPTLNIGRALAPELFELNRQGAYNGHIPVTAINSAILVVAALLRSVDQVVFSNERSASYGSLIPGTGEVNHQWSKGWAFESLFGAHVQRFVAADLHYYSLLRPLSELAVARQFARTDHYDAHFSSCNRNFHILGERPVNRWCGQCPKCHFVFLALSNFMPKPRLLNIFGRNLLDDPAQTAGFDALLEYQDHKPFECVGEGRESRAAMAALGQRPEWREDALVARFNREIAPQLDAAELQIAPLLQPEGEHRIPPALWEQLRANFAA